jgi:hypothetical protein
MVYNLWMTILGKEAEEAAAPRKDEAVAAVPAE